MNALDPQLVLSNPEAYTNIESVRALATALMLAKVVTPDPFNLVTQALIRAGVLALKEATVWDNEIIYHTRNYESVKALSPEYAIVFMVSNKGAVSAHAGLVSNLMLLECSSIRTAVVVSGCDTDASPARIDVYGTLGTDTEADLELISAEYHLDSHEIYRARRAFDEAMLDGYEDVSRQLANPTNYNDSRLQQIWLAWRDGWILGIRSLQLA